MRLRNFPEDMIRSDVVVSAIGATETYHGLLGVKTPYEWYDVPSATHVVLSCGFRGDGRDLGLGAKNYWIYRNDVLEVENVNQMAEPFSGEEEKDVRGYFICFPSLRDGSQDKERFTGMKVVQIFLVLKKERFVMKSGKPFIPFF